VIVLRARIAHTEIIIIIIVYEVAVVVAASGIGAATFTKLGGILIFAIALKGFAIGKR